MRTPYLIQRATINTPLAPGKTRISNSVDLDYMGSAEFEFGALPRSLRALQKGKRILRKVEIKEGEAILRVLSIFETEEEFLSYVEYLNQLRAGTIRLKETIRFSPDRINSEYAEDFWWDIENHVMWSFNKRFMNRLESYLQGSFEYMDAPE